MPTEKNIAFTPNEAATGGYMKITVELERVVASWRDSLFSFEWLHPDGRIRAMHELKPAEQARRAAVEQALQTGGPVTMPVLGIGMMENIEIGSGRAELLTLAAHGIKTAQVHIPRSCESDFKPFRADVDSGS